MLNFGWVDRFGPGAGVLEKVASKNRRGQIKTNERRRS